MGKNKKASETLVHDTIQEKTVKKFFPHASGKNISEYLDTLRWIEEMLFHWASIIDTTDDAVLSKDLNGIVKSWNTAAERIYGYSSKEIVGKSILTIFPKGKEPELQYILKKIKKGERIEHLTTERVRKDKKVIVISATVSPLKDITGRTVGASVIARDITEQKKADEARFKLAAIIDSSNDAIISKDLNGVITSWNKGAEKMYGYKEAEVLGKKISILIPAENREELPHILKRLKEDKSITPYETTRIRKDGKIINVSLTVSPIKDHVGNVIGGSKIAHEITEHLELQRQKELNQQKNDFISMASHELKTPLTTLKAYIQISQKEGEKIGSEVLEKALPKADKQINKLTKLVNELLILSRLEEGNTLLQKEQFDLDELVGEIIDDCKNYSDKHTFIVEGAIGKKIFADKAKIEQVIINLISNAVKYSSNTERIIIRLAKDKKNAIVSVQDFGIGISKEFHGKVFSKFYQGTNKEEKTYPGMGIGLYVSSEIIKSHEGEIWVESVKGKGSTFTFSIPFTKK
jgi:PAS domain S-box-containing protein